MASSGLKVLYVPNEAQKFRQVGFRRPLSNLKDAGLLGDINVFSLQWRILEGGDPEQHRQDLVQRVKSFQPDIVLMQHLGVTGMRAKHFLAMRDSAEFKLIYHEADPYSRFLHPLPRAAGVAGRYSDVVYTVGTGCFAHNFRRTGATDVRWASHVFEAERYKFKSVDLFTDRPYDIVMIANRNTPRFRGLPNWKDRVRFVEYMQDRFAGQFAVYGRGWSGPSALGPIDFSLQDTAIRSGWISANWDHFANESSYYSNRLPISLSVGSVHATGWHPGYDEVFGEQTREFLMFAKSHEQLADRIENLLDTTTFAARVELGKKAQAFAYENLRQDDQLVDFLNFDGEILNKDAARAAWDVASNHVLEV